jgi:hypothetical protein
VSAPMPNLHPYFLPAPSHPRRAALTSPPRRVGDPSQSLCCTRRPRTREGPCLDPARRPHTRWPSQWGCPCRELPGLPARGSSPHRSPLPLGLRREGRFIRTLNPGRVSPVGGAEAALLLLALSQPCMIPPPQKCPPPLACNLNLAVRPRCHDLPYSPLVLPGTQVEPCGPGQQAPPLQASFSDLDGSDGEEQEG